MHGLKGWASGPKWAQQQYGTARCGLTSGVVGLVTAFLLQVGLPARGKTFICNKILCFLNWCVPRRAAPNAYAMSCHAMSCML